MAKVGRKKIEIDWVKLNSYLQLRASKGMCAALLDVSEDTLERRVNEEFKVKFAEYAEKMIAPVKLKLVQKIISKALDGDNVCLIFSLKNMVGWADKVEHGLNEDKKQILLKYSIEPKTVGPKADKGTTGQE
jgi:hypothetical protein